MGKECTYVSKKIVKQEKEDVNNALNNIKNDFKNYFGKSFNHSMVGSARRNLVVRKGEQPWDIDFQIRLSSPVFFGNDFTPMEVKEKVRDLLKSKLSNNYNLTLSTSVITITNRNDQSITFDIAIIRTSDSGWEILRGKENISTGEYFRWEQLSNTANTTKDVKQIKGSDKWKSFRKIYKDKKCFEYSKESKDDRKSSNALFAETVNEVLQY